MDETSNIAAKGPDMIQNGYRLYRGLDGVLRLDQIVAGRIYPLHPDASDAKRALGFYDSEFKLIPDARPH